jgi:hypothetical protein
MQMLIIISFLGNSIFTSLSEIDFTIEFIHGEHFNRNSKTHDSIVMHWQIELCVMLQCLNEHVIFLFFV